MTHVENILREIQEIARERDELATALHRLMTCGDDDRPAALKAARELATTNVALANAILSERKRLLDVA